MTTSTIFSRRGVILSVVLFVCAILLYFALGAGVYYCKEYAHHYESGAVSDLFALHTMQENYRKDHGAYAATFSQLGLPLGARLNSEVLTWNGPYDYRIIGTVRNQVGAIQDYSIDARPEIYSAGSRRSYLMDHNGIIHFTSMNRGATTEDSSIPPER